MEETKISINYLFRSFKRNWLYMLYFVVCFFVIGCVYAAFFNVPAYRSEAILSTTSVYYTQTMKEVVENDEKVARVVLQNVADKGLTHKDGTLISLSEITSGLTIVAQTSEPQLIIEYTNSDSSVVQLILNEILNVGKDAINEAYPAYRVNIYSYATNPVNIAQSNVKIVVLFSAAGVCIGAIAAIINELRQNILYEPSDIENIDFGVFEITYDKEKKANEII